jgi:hypothetical protein
MGFFSDVGNAERRFVSGPVGGSTGGLSEATKRSGKTGVLSTMFFFSSFSGVFTCGNVFE